MSKRRVSEPTPVQVYLDKHERRALERLASELGTSKSEVPRRRIKALGQR